jgi:glucosamine--fructose-6-phosphate aminotransferase (isomerizing)
LWALNTPPKHSFAVCGIIGCVAEEPVAGILLDGLRRVEYRGYDSAGMVTMNKGRLTVKKGAGRIQEIEARHRLTSLKGEVGMAHTRWATHGGVTDENAHPQTSCHESVAVVHNGIIENYLPLKKGLQARGHRFKSETDTEVIAHLIEQEYRKWRDPVKAVSAATKKLRGQYAIAVMLQDRPGVIVGARKDAPLVIGVGERKMFIASDILAFIEHTDRSIFLDNYEVAQLTKAGVRIFGPGGREVKRKPTQVAWELSDISKLDYAHYTLKEINEQPQTVVSASVQEAQHLRYFAEAVRGARSVFIAAAGTSYHAGLLMKFRLQNEAKLRCETILAGEFREHAGFVSRGSVVITLSQSGETADVLEAVKEAKKRGAKVLSIVNAAGSTLARESDEVLLLNCGPEVGVAATKSFTAQVVVANMVVDAILGRKRLNGMEELSQGVKEALTTEQKVKEIVTRYIDRSDFYFVAKGYQSPVALEGALKLKELSYIHAEGMPASELKHGTLALIEKGTPVVVINPTGSSHADVLSNAEELKARGAEIIGISDRSDPVYSHFLRIPKVQPKFMPIVEAVPLQLLAYYSAVARRKDPDYPRNLAKSVTVK